MAAAVIADVSTADCTRTRISLELLGAPQLPASLGVRLTPTHDTALPTMNTIATRLTDGRYFTPALLLPLGEYRVEALDPVTQQLIAFDVLNTATIATIRARASLRTPVQVRRAPRLADTKREVTSLQLHPSYDRGATSAHIILVDDAGVFLDQYFGKPVPVWQSRPLSSYNVYAFGAQYFADGRCQPMPLRSAE
jgi:hypothetical protein